MIMPTHIRASGLPWSGLLATAALGLLLAGCSNRKDAVEQVGAEEMYSQGQQQLLNANYAGAILTLQNLTYRYPFSPQTRQAQLDLIYAYYRSGQPDSAVDAAESFIRENPRLGEVAYCRYMIGLIHFDREANFIERLFHVDVTERPPKESMDSFDSFQTLIRDYPDSPYVEDARQHMVFLRNRLATYENHVANYYLARGAYVAAIDRAKYALEHYSGAPDLEESLRIMIQCYDALGMRDLARDTQRVLEENFGQLGAVDADPDAQ
jgi:outer membrane protein assembly factor BamD